MTLVYTSTSGPTEAVVELTTPGPSRHTTIRQLDTGDIDNASTLSGATLTDALDGLASSLPATGSAPGYLSRLWFTTPGTFPVWSVPADVPPGNLIELVAWSGGGAGGNGKFQNAAGTSMNPSTGAGGGCRISRLFARADIIAALPISVTVGAAVAPPARPTVQNTDQVSNPGTLSAWVGALGPLVTAYGGGAGQAFNLGTGGGGGGSLGTGLQNGAAATNEGGSPGGSTRGDGVGGGGGQGGNEGSGFGDNGFAAAGGGGGGGGSGSANIANGANGGNADQGAGGGGGGGRMDTSSGTPGATGGRGGGSGPRIDGVINGSGAAGGIVGPPGGPGANAPDLAANDANYGRSGNGGGGGAPSSVVGQVGGAGGNGGAPGGGGGAGGHGRGANGTPFGGLAGIGARGQAACTFYL